MEIDDGNHYTKIGFSLDMIPLSKCEHIWSSWVFFAFTKKIFTGSLRFSLRIYFVNVNEVLEKTSDMSTFTKNILSGKLVFTNCLRFRRNRKKISRFLLNGFKMVYYMVVLFKKMCQCRILNLVKHLRWSFLRKLIFNWILNTPLCSERFLEIQPKTPAL